jgi:Siphovirus Gp157
MSDELNLYHIERDLAELMEMREAHIDNLGDGNLAERGLTAIDQAIKEYAAREVAKVDSIRGYLRWAQVQIDAARAEVQTQRTRIGQLEDGVERLKSFCVEAIQSAGKNFIEGKTGRLKVAVNGGEQPLVITDESLIPDHLCWMEGRINADVWYDLLNSEIINKDCYHLNRIPSNALIRAALEKACPNCDGHGKYCARCGLTIECKCGDAAEDGTCHACSGTGQAGVPGAHLAERGVHLRVK